MRISVILPAFNEEASIAHVVGGVRGILESRAGEGFEVLVVDDGSRDATAALAEAAGARVIRHPYNIGNGAAVKTGIRHARGEILVFMDADGQHNAGDIPSLVEMISRFDLVVGARTDPKQSAAHRNWANALYNALAGYVTGQKILDLTSGFRAVRADVARRFVYLLPNTFSYPTTLTLACFRAGHSVTYLPISVNRRQGRSKIRLMVDGPRFGLIILKIATFFAPMKIFLPLSLLFFAGGLGNYLYTYITQQRFTNMSALMFIAALLVFLLGMISDQIASLRFDRSEDPPVATRG